MKKAIAAVALAAALGLTGLQQVSAAVQDTKAQGAESSRQVQKVDDATKEKIAKFHADTRDIRRQVAMKMAEETALIQSENPNVEAVKKAAGELFDLRVSLFAKAKDAGLFAFAKRGVEDGKNADRQAKIEKFMADTQDLRKQLFIKRAEEKAVLNSQNPNPAAASQVAGELFELKTSLQEKAVAAGMVRPYGMMERRGGKAYHGYRCDSGMMDHGMMPGRDMMEEGGVASGLGEE
jgi:hypothetical protein